MLSRKSEKVKSVYLLWEKTNDVREKGAKSFYRATFFHHLLLRFLFQGNGVLELIHPTSLADGAWHEIKTQFNPRYMEITVDGETRTMRPPKGENRRIDLTGPMYFGGIDSEKRRSRARDQGVRSAEEGLQQLQGCLQGLLLDGKEIGLPEVKETKGIKAECVWTFPCLDCGASGGGDVDKSKVIMTTSRRRSKAGALPPKGKCKF